MTTRVGLRCIGDFFGKRQRFPLAEGCALTKIFRNSYQEFKSTIPRVSPFSSNTFPKYQVKSPAKYQVSTNALHNFAEKINWSLSNDELLINALTHKSYVSSDTPVLGSSFAHNERIVFLGYQTTASFVVEILYFKYPSLKDDQLWDLQNGLLHDDLLAECGRKLGLSDLIFTKDEITDKIMAESLLAVIGSLYMDQTSGFARQFVETNIIPDLTEEMIKDICQLEHPKFMLKILTTKEVKAKLLNKTSTEDIYGEKREEFKVGIYSQGEILAEGQGNSQLNAEKNASRKVLKKMYSKDLKNAMFPLEYKEYEAENEVNFGLLTEGIRQVEIVKGKNGFGFLVKGGEMKAKENKEYVKYTYYFPPFVSGIIEGEPAQRCQNLRVGDVIMAINDKNTKGMSHQMVVNYLNSIKDKVKLTVQFDKKVLICDELETKFTQFKENKLLSQLTNTDWAQWHYANAKEKGKEYNILLEKDLKKS